MNRILLLFPVIFIFSCSVIQNASNKVEESHYALYRQKALIVSEVRKNRVIFMNPALTRCYYLRGRTYTQKWAAGDTLLINDNLEDFYNLKFLKQCAGVP
jgi:hypothetical protein